MPISYFTLSTFKIFLWIISLITVIIITLKIIRLRYNLRFYCCIETAFRFGKINIKEMDIWIGEKNY